MSGNSTRRPRRESAETILLRRVLGEAEHWGWLRFHPLPATNSKGKTRTWQAGDSGWVDLALMHEERGLALFWELKADKGRVEDDQRKWHKAMTAAGLTVEIMRPRDWPRIVEILSDGRGFLRPGWDDICEPNWSARTVPLVQDLPFTEPVDAGERRARGTLEYSTVELRKQGWKYGDDPRQVKPPWLGGQAAS